MIQNKYFSGLVDVQSLYCQQSNMFSTRLLHGDKWNKYKGTRCKMNQPFDNVMVLFSHICCKGALKGNLPGCLAAQKEIIMCRKTEGHCFSVANE